MRRLYLLSAALAGGAVLCACVSGPPPNEELTRARTLVEQAEKAQAARYAPEDLQHARERLAEADADDQHGRYDSARQEAESAAVDADVAAARATEAQSMAALEEMRHGNAVLRESAPGDRDAPPDLEDYPPAAPGAAVPPPPRERAQPPDDTQNPR